MKIKNVFNNGDLFSFTPVTYEEVQGEILKLNESKCCPTNSVPTKMIKENCDLFAYKLYYDINHSISISSFPDNLKLADITPAHKSGSKTDKSHFRPVSILSAMSKIFERFISKQLNFYMDEKLSIYQCGFRKQFNSQHCILLLIEKWKKSLDKKGFAGAILTDLSKAFDCLDHELLLAKCEAYGFTFNAIKLISSYLTNRKQRVKVESNYSS